MKQICSLVSLSSKLSRCSSLGSYTLWRNVLKVSLRNKYLMEATASIHNSVRIACVCSERNYEKFGSKQLFSNNCGHYHQVSLPLVEDVAKVCQICKANRISEQVSKRTYLKSHCSISPSSLLLVKPTQMSGWCYRRHSPLGLTASFSTSAQFKSPVSETGTKLTTEVVRPLLWSDFPIVSGAESMIQAVHQLSGLPWWSTIVLTAFFLRVILMIPLTVYTQLNATKLQNLMPEIQVMVAQTKYDVGVAMHKHGWDQKRARMEYDNKVKENLRQLYIRDNCHPMKNVASFWVHMPFWIGISFALRNISTKAVRPELEGHNIYQSLVEGGILWFPDLSVCDSTWLLPAAVGMIFLINIEMTYLNVGDVTGYRKLLTYFLRGLSVCMVPVCASMPSSMVLYWLSSGVFSAVQNVLFEYSPFRRLFKLPKSPTESHSPLHSLGSKARTRYFEKK